MPRNNTATLPDQYGLTATNHAVVVVTTHSGAMMQTDTSRLAGYRPDQRRSRIATRHGEAMNIYDDEIDEVIAMLMRFRTQMPEAVEELPADTVDADMF